MWTKNIQSYVTFCDSWILLKYNHLNSLDFQCISSNNIDPWLYFKFISETVPFRYLNNQNFNLFIHNNSKMNESSVGKYTNDSSIINQISIFYKILN